ncbi:MAG: 23S rRNA (guanosine(2251)-2'-O)-methyltransferase RlmB [Bacteroidia bacterium]|jgi:23S rRNA (guanosine2251-2'-O)-methyltransferase
MKEEYTIYGIHAVTEAFDAGKEINKILVAKGLKNDQAEEVIKRARNQQIPVQFVPRESSVFPRQRNHQFVVALLSPISYHSLEDILPKLFEEGKNPFILVLDHITDVRNFGAISRSAYCAGVHAIVVPFEGAAPVNEDAVKTSAGALLKIPVCREKNFKSTMELLNQSGVTTVACTEKANKDIAFVDLTGPVAIIMGSEETGISSEVIKRCGSLVKIPLEQGVGSLNVSVAAGIAVYETVRQRMAAVQS